VVRQLGQFLNADTCVAQYLDRCPSPEPGVFFEGQIAVDAGGRVYCPDVTVGNALTAGGRFRELIPG
jgi:hypothetical protein